MSADCLKCGNSFKTRRVLSQHVRTFHLIEFVSYVVKHEYAGLKPSCACGCGKNVRFYKGKFKKFYANGHQKGTYKWSDERKKRCSESNKRFFLDHPEHGRRRSIKMKERWNNDYENMKQMLLDNMSSYMKDEEKSKEWKQRISEAISTKYVNGEFHYKCGIHLSPKSSKKSYYRSSWELRHMLAMDADPSVISYTIEPFFIVYELDGKIHRYIPDFLIKRSDGHSELQEIGVRLIKESLPKNIAKMQAAQEFCKNNCYTYRLISF